MADYMQRRGAGAIRLLTRGELEELALRQQDELVNLSQRDLLTRAGLRRIFRVSDRTLRRVLPLLPRPTFQIGQKQYWLKSSLIRWIEESEHARRG